MRDTSKKIGYFCSLVPEEIIVAAGMQPVRVAGKTDAVSTADAYLYPNLCPYIKNVFVTALDGGTKDLDGVVFARSCDGMRRMHDTWKAYVNTKFIYMLEVPKNKDEQAIQYYASQLRDFAGSLGQAFGMKIKTEALNKAIKSTIGLRRLMQSVYDLQKKSPLPVKGSELFEAGLSAIGEDRKIALEKINNVYKRAKAIESTKGKAKKVRILISGNVMDRPDLFNIVEEAGADVPAADLCTASRYFDRRVEEGGDPYLALARAYLGAPHCSRTATPGERLAETREIVKAYSIDGVILTSLKFCDCHLHDIPYISKNLTAEGTPVLFLENDYTFSNRSQLKTRVEAFIEILNQ